MKKQWTAWTTAVLSETQQTKIIPSSFLKAKTFQELEIKMKIVNLLHFEALLKLELQLFF